MKKSIRCIFVLLFVSIGFSTYALDPGLTLEDHIRIREQQREDYDKNQKILKKQKEQQRAAVLEEMQQSPFQQEIEETARSGKLMNPKRKYTQWIILAFLLVAMLFVHYRSRKQTD